MKEHPLKDTRIMRLEVFNNKKKSTNPNSKYIQKLKAKIDNEDRLEALHKLKRESRLKKYHYTNKYKFHELIKSLFNINGPIRDDVAVDYALIAYCKTSIHNRLNWNSTRTPQTPIDLPEDGDDVPLSSGWCQLPQILSPSQAVEKKGKVIALKNGLQAKTNSTAYQRIEMMDESILPILGDQHMTTAEFAECSTIPHISETVMAINPIFNWSEHRILPMTCKTSSELLPRDQAHNRRNRMRRKMAPSQEPVSSQQEKKPKPLGDFRGKYLLLMFYKRNEPRISPKLATHHEVTPQ